MRDRALTLTLALLALLLFCGLFVERKPEVKSSMASSVDIGEQGVAAAFHWLQNRDVPVSSWRKPWFELADARPQGNVLVSFVPFRAQEENTGVWGDAPGNYVSSREEEQLVHWIAAGNTHVIALSAFDAFGNTENLRNIERDAFSYIDLLRPFGWELQGSALTNLPETEDQEEEEEADSEENSESDDVGKEEIGPVGSSAQALHKLRLQLNPNQAPIDFETKAWEVQGTKTLQLQPLDVEADCNNEPSDEQSDDEVFENDDEDEVVDLAPPIIKSKQPPVESIQTEADLALERERCLRLGIKQAVVILRSAVDDTPAGWWLPLGRGGVVVLGYGNAWRNPNLNQPGAALALENLLRYYLQGGEVLFDDGHYGLSSIYDPAALLKDPRLYWTLTIAGLFWLLYAVGRSRRLLPVRLPKTRASTATFAKAITDFYARQLTDKDLAEALIAHFLRHARRALAMPNVSEDELWRRLSNDPRLDAAEIATIQALSSGIDTVKLGQILIHQHARLVR